MALALRYPFERLYPLTQGFSAEHPALDWGAPLHTPVLAAADGVTLKVDEQMKGYGLYVVIQHEGGSVTLYAHLAQAWVVRRQRVQAGQPIGLSGNSGNSTGPHLHFEYRPDGSKAADPSPFFTALCAEKDEGTGRAAPAQPPADSFRAGEWVILKGGYRYVNLRPQAAFGAQVADIGDYTGGAAVQVLEQEGEMVAVKVWIHGGYLERALTPGPSPTAGRGGGPDRRRRSHSGERGRA